MRTPAGRDRLGAGPGLPVTRGLDPAAANCEAFRYFGKATAVLHLGGIRSPLDAVRAAIVAERRGQS